MNPIFFLLAGCVLVVDDDDTDGLRTCAQVHADFVAEAARIRSCTDDAQCGLVLTGTSCGCTRDWVARRGVDTAGFYALIDEALGLGCDLGLTSTCDCPEAEGFDCAGGTCTWDYVDPDALPACRADDGDPYTVEGASIAGSLLAVTVSASGGCAEHDWTLCWPDQSFAESSPVQARLELLHDDHDDPCDAIITEDLVFDLAPLARAWHEAYGTGPGSMVVVIGDERLAWSF